MDIGINIEKLIKKGEIANELELERASIAERQLKLLSKENLKFKDIRRKLRKLIADYEDRCWDKNSPISSSKIKESDIAESIAEKERLFFEKRKQIIRKKLKSLDLTQQDLGILLGHHSKSYISELMNNVSPFSLKDLIKIHLILKIKLSELIPTVLSQKDIKDLSTSISKLQNDKLQFNPEDMEYA